jgi:hypothetical protein
MTKPKKFFVAYLIVPEIPEDGYDQVFYYSATEESYPLGKYYWGKGNNSFDQDFLNGLIRSKKICRLDSDTYPMELEDNETLWVDKNGHIYIADINDPITNQRKLKNQELIVKNAIKNIYNKSISELIFPEIVKEVCIKC